MTSQLRRFVTVLQHVMRHKAGLVGASLVTFFILVAVLAPLIESYNPVAQQLTDRLQPGFWAGDYHHFLGTDQLGRDVLARMIFGSRISLLVGFVAITSMATIGSGLGLLAAYFGGVVDAIIMRLADMFLAFPAILLAIAIVAALGPGSSKATIALVLVFTPRMARIIRGATLVVLETQYIQSARALGSRDLRIVTRHALPNVASNIITFSTLFMGQAILFMASLGFLGLGVQPPTPEWGAMIGSGKDYLVLGQWWLATFPGIAIALSVLGFILLGDALRDVLDPRIRTSEATT